MGDVSRRTAVAKKCQKQPSEEKIQSIVLKDHPQ